jgi:hypothetical protein
MIHVQTKHKPSSGLRVGLTTEELNNTINYNQVAWDVGRCVETAVTLGSFE